jgi:hypothetical protein
LRKSKALLLGKKKYQSRSLTAQPNNFERLNMAEPNTSAVVATTVAMGSLSTLLGIDGNALIGAFAGGALIAISSKNLSPVERFAYMCISIIAGYLTAPELLAMTPLQQSGVAAFIAAAAAIALVMRGLALIKMIQLPTWLKGGDRNG